MQNTDENIYKDIRTFETCKYEALRTQTKWRNWFPNKGGPN